MDTNSLRQWESASDEAEQQLDMLMRGLPAQSPLGTEHVHTHVTPPRKWVRVQVESGVIGGRWAYWSYRGSLLPHRYVRHDDGVNAVCVLCRHSKDNPLHEHWGIIVDRLFNGDAAHFAGMLGEPYAGKRVTDTGSANVDSRYVWILTEPRVREIPASEQPSVLRPTLEMTDKTETRYERSKEVYDVDSGRTEILP
jgi:hypothetical protein